MIGEQQFDRARTLLERLPAHTSNDAEPAFLLGMIALSENKPKMAVSHFRTALVHSPKATRIRLELARAFYLARDYENAFRQFQLARAGNPPEAVVRTIDRFIALIRREKRWSYNMSVTLAPDSNINNATSAREALIFGLPFELADEARQHSGVGVALQALVEHAPRLSDRVRLRLGVGAQHRDYAGSRFDDTRIALHAGPRLILDDWDISLLGTAFRRRYGGRRYSDMLGARLEASHYPDARTAFSIALSAQDARHPDAPAYDGPVVSANVTFARALAPSSAMALRGGISRQAARAPELASWSGLLGFGYQRELRGGVSVFVEPSFVYSQFDAVDPLFGRRRQDWTAEVAVALLHRKIVLSRFTPKVTYTHARRSSNIEIYRFRQNRLEVGLTTTF